MNISCYADLTHFLDTKQFQFNTPFHLPQTSEINFIITKGDFFTSYSSLKLHGTTCVLILSLNTKMYGKEPKSTIGKIVSGDWGEVYSLVEQAQLP